MRKFILVFWTAACQSPKFIIGLGAYYWALSLTGNVEFALAVRQYVDPMLFAVMMLEAIRKLWKRPARKEYRGDERLQWSVQTTYRGTFV